MLGLAAWPVWAAMGLLSVATGIPGVQSYPAALSPIFSTESTARNRPCMPLQLRGMPTLPNNARDWETKAIQYANSLSSMMARGEVNETSAVALARIGINSSLQPAAVALGAPQLGLGILFIANPPRLIVFQQNSTTSMPYYWRALASSWNGSAPVWSPAWLSCEPPQPSWWTSVSASRGSGALRAAFAIFKKLDYMNCERPVLDWLGTESKCDPLSTECQVDLSSEEYKCRCRRQWYSGNESATASSLEWVRGESISGIFSCIPCPMEEEPQPLSCHAHSHQPALAAGLLAANLTGMALTLLIALIIFRKRKCKAVAIGMWTVLEVIIFGIFLIYASAAVQYASGAEVRCLAGAWLRELGFVAAYGSMVLRLWVLLAEFRTRKAHRWTPKDSEVLRVVGAMLAGCVCYLGAFTATAACGGGEGAGVAGGCARTHWHHVTAAAESLLLLAGVRVAYAARNSRAPYYERKWLAGGLGLEAVNVWWWRVAAALWPHGSPELSPPAATARAHLSAAIALLCVFAPKLFYSLTASNHLSQDVSRRGPAEGFFIEGDENTEPTSEEVRAELKRLYVQLEILRNKTLRKDNPHISKRRGGRKPPHRRFSLQALQARRGAKSKANAEVSEVGDASRTPEDSVCSAEAPSHYTDGDTQA